MVDVNQLGRAIRADPYKRSLYITVRSAQDALSVIDEDPEARALLPFNPAFTYPIFGEKEKIYGYKGLQVEVRACHNATTSRISQWLTSTI
jgi:histone acetyltransferase 1